MTNFTTTPRPLAGKSYAATDLTALVNNVLYFHDASNRQAAITAGAIYTGVNAKGNGYPAVKSDGGSGTVVQITTHGGPIIVGISASNTRLDASTTSAVFVEFDADIGYYEGDLWNSYILRAPGQSGVGLYIPYPATLVNGGYHAVSLLKVFESFPAGTYWVGVAVTLNAASGAGIYTDLDLFACESL